MMDGLPGDARALRRKAFERLTELLETTERTGPYRPGNNLPQTLSADNILASPRALREAEPIRPGTATNFRGALDESRTIWKGLQ
jgi:flagellar biosynthesis regulator FlaF